MNSMSQEEIDALLNGGNTEGSPAPAVSEPPDASASTAEPADAGADTASAPPPVEVANTFPNGRTLSTDEKDIIGEIGNICMGSAATTMYTLLNRRVEITTPVVEVLDVESLSSQFDVPFVAVEIAYTEGIEGQNLLLLRDRDAALITDILMGGEGDVSEPYELGELHLSAICEVMNQMAGASATALSNILQMPTNISPPTAKVVMNGDDAVSETIRGDTPLIKTSFRMEIEGVLESNIMQIMPYSFCKTLASRLLSEQQGDDDIIGMEQKPNDVVSQPAAPASPPPPPQGQPSSAPPVQGESQYAAPQPSASQPAAVPQYAAPPMTQPYSPQYAAPQQVQSVQYPSFDNQTMAGTPSQYSSEAIGRIVDVPLQVNVVLGNSKKSIREILEFSIGTVIMLDKVAGDPVDVMVNGKLIAKGEVVVIEDNYGVRITEVLSTRGAF